MTESEMLAKLIARHNDLVEDHISQAVRVNRLARVAHFLVNRIEVLEADRIKPLEPHKLVPMVDYAMLLGDKIDKALEIAQETLGLAGRLDARLSALERHHAEDDRDMRKTVQAPPPVYCDETGALGEV